MNGLVFSHLNEKLVMKALGYGNLKHHINPVRNFGTGLEKHGLKVKYIGTREVGVKYAVPNLLNDYDFVVCWAMRAHNWFKELGFKNILVMENAPLNNIQEAKKEWASCGWNGLMGRADFLNENMPDDRWKKHFDDGRLLDYSDGDYILIPLQIKTDMSIAGKGFDYQTIVDEIRKFTDLPIKIKQHPTAEDNWSKILGKDISYVDRFMPIKDAIKGAKVVVTINSNAGVDAVLAGKPVVALDKGSMVYDIAAKDFTNLNVPKWPDRTQWCNNIAYAQWHPDELRAGEGWNHLKQKLFTNTQT
jgi:hypothetical protein